MGKVKAPLLSLGASGQIGKTLVYFNWKGINVVREYVVPSNPKTTAQETQRAYITAAVAAIHAAQALVSEPLASADQVAYSALAAAKGKIMTWFNQACKLWVDVEVDSKVPCLYRNLLEADLDVENFDITLYISEKTGSTLAAGKFYFGTTRTNMINNQAATIVAGVAAQINVVDLSAFLTAGVKYFLQFRPDSGDGCEGANSGIYHFVAE